MVCLSIFVLVSGALGLLAFLYSAFAGLVCVWSDKIADKIGDVTLKIFISGSMLFLIALILLPFVAEYARQNP